MKKIRIGIVGGAGYTGGELLRILLNHPYAEIVYVNSKSHASEPVCSVHKDLIGETDLQFTEKVNDDIDVLYLCLGHGDTKKWLLENSVGENVKVIDLSQDHRLANPDFVYGLPELHQGRIKIASKIANPGCFATCIQLALLPMAAHQLLTGEIHVSATTGSTGAGQSLNETSHFSWRQNNLSVYKAFGHQHLSEIEQSIKYLQAGFDSKIHFIPQRGSFTRGIFASIYTQCGLEIDELVKLYQNYYSGHPFVVISDDAIDLKQVANTNKCLLHLEKHGENILVTACIDNLIKGASGQAVQNMNLMFDLNETEGLKLKANYF